MLVVLIIFISVAMMVAVDLGRRRGNAHLQAIVEALEAAIPAAQRDYVRLTGSCYGFEYAGTSPYQAVRGTILILPRFAPLYLPLARSAGRSDLLRLTVQCTTLPLGIGSILRSSAPLIPFNEALEDPDLRVHKMTTSRHEYEVFAYNPIMEDRLSALASELDRVDHFAQLTCDHRDATLRVFLVPEPATLRDELCTLLELMNSLTAG